jgi:hypothetical protein
MEFPKRYSYNPSLLVGVLCAIFFAVCSLLIGGPVAQEDRGLVINGIIELGPQGARNFYWVLAVLSALMSLGGLALIVRLLLFPKILELGENALMLPCGFMQWRIDCIRYADIQELSEGRINSQTFLTIMTSGGRKYHVMRSMFHDGQRYTEVRDYLASRVVGNECCPASS